MPLWRFSVGTKGVNRVTVYERRHGASIYIEWADDEGRHQQALKSRLGHPVTDRELAKRIAKKVSEEQEKKRNRQAEASAFGYIPTRTLGELLDRVHMGKARKWSKKYATDCLRFKEFWSAQLGAERMLDRITPDLVERTVEVAGEGREWSQRTRLAYLRYIVDAFYYGQHKLKWFGEDRNLSGVDFPEPSTTSRAYTSDEVARLLPALRKVDLRAAFVGEVAWQTGRRLNAIRSLHTVALEVSELDGQRVGVLTFPGVTDKARRSGTVALVGEALEIAEELKTKPAVRASGLFVPGGKLEGKGTGAPCHDRFLIEWLHEAEKLVGITPLEGRAYHGIKRRFATDAEDRRAAAKQSGTREDTLRQHYEQDDMGPKIELAKKLDSKRRRA
jgi:integrase